MLIKPDLINIYSLISYSLAPFSGIFFLLTVRGMDHIRFHAWQSIIFGFSYIIILIFLQILELLLGRAFALLGITVGLLVPITMSGAFILWIVCMVKAYQGERWRIPFLGDIAAKKAGLL